MQNSRKDGYLTFAMSVLPKEKEQIQKQIKFLRKHLKKDILRSQCKINKPFEHHASNKDVIMYCLDKVMRWQLRIQATDNEANEYWRTYYDKLEKEHKERTKRFDRTVSLG